MKQAIAGVAPVGDNEVTSMTVWPGNTSVHTPPLGRLGCLLGRLYNIRFGLGSILTVGNLLALASIPIALQLFVVSLLPGFARRYVLTNRRVLVQRKKFSWRAPWVDEMAVSLDNFDQIEVVVQKGQDWYPAGDLVFRNGDVETLRLLGIVRPETFRRTCLKAHASYVGVQKATISSP